MVLAPVSQPLLANPSQFRWSLIWSSESPGYGGGGAQVVETEEGWHIPGHAAMVVAAK
jgi:maltooligosyltrehalose trehalohydrolase